jgi:hypothetical protein
VVDFSSGADKSRILSQIRTASFDGRHRSVLILQDEAARAFADLNGWWQSRRPFSSDKIGREHPRLRMISSRSCYPSSPSPNSATISDGWPCSLLVMTRRAAMEWRLSSRGPHLIPNCRRTLPHWDIRKTERRAGTLVAYHRYGFRSSLSATVSPMPVGKVSATVW